MVFFPKVLAFFQEIAIIWQKFRDFCFGLVFLETFKIQRLAWIFLWIFLAVLYLFHQCALNVALSQTSFESIFVVTDCVFAPPLPPPIHPKISRQSSEYFWNIFIFNKFLKNLRRTFLCSNNVHCSTYIVGPSFNIYFVFVWTLGRKP
jgi:hypothetical protein